MVLKITSFITDFLFSQITHESAFLEIVADMFCFFLDTYWLHRVKLNNKRLVKVLIIFEEKIYFKKKKNLPLMFPNMLCIIY